MDMVESDFNVSGYTCMLDMVGSAAHDPGKYGKCCQYLGFMNLQCIGEK